MRSWKVLFRTAWSRPDRWGAGPRGLDVGAALLALLIGLGCGGEPASEAGPDAAGAEAEADVAEAESLYAAAVFDTVRWNRSVTRSERGRVVYYYSCTKCHGTEGAGNGPLARRQEIALPSLVDPDWTYDGDIDAIRRRVFVGHPAGMPSWGLTEISPRDMDAVAYFVDQRLPEEGVGGGPIGE